MKIKDHVILAFIAVVAWVLFYILGIPSNYYQDWNFAELVLLSLITLFGFVPFISAVVIILMNGDYVKTGLWFAFYGSVLLALLDFLVCGLIQGRGVSVFVSHWYVTAGYAYVWIEGPLVGYILKKFRNAAGKGQIV